eukprot:jgi/Botrbrau1/3026/Bobra.0070s0022.1
MGTSHIVSITGPTRCLRSPAYIPLCGRTTRPNVSTRARRGRIQKRRVEEGGEPNADALGNEAAPPGSDEGRFSALSKALKLAQEAAAEAAAKADAAAELIQRSNSLAEQASTVDTMEELRDAAQNVRQGQAVQPGEQAVQSAGQAPPTSQRFAGSDALRDAMASLGGEAAPSEGPRGPLRVPGVLREYDPTPFGAEPDAEEPWQSTARSRPKAVQFKRYNPGGTTKEATSKASGEEDEGEEGGGYGSDEEWIDDGFGVTLVDDWSDGNGGGRSSKGEEVEEVFSLDRGWLLEDSLEPSQFSNWSLLEADEEGAAAAEQLLEALPPHQRKRLQTSQQEAADLNEATRANARRKVESERKTHKRLRIVGGAFAGKRLLSSQGSNTRPMMEKVRCAVFDMLASAYGGSGILPENTRWLDLFAGTGSVGLEAMSRGVGEATFVEADPWVVTHVLRPNITSCGIAAHASIHTGRVEEYLRQAATRPAYSPPPFNFISVCPPYMLVSYQELYSLLKDSPLLAPTSMVVVEYPKAETKNIAGTLGELVKLRDRRYGRTNVAIYGPLTAEVIPDDD